MDSLTESMTKFVLSFDRDKSDYKDIERWANEFIKRLLDQMLISEEQGAQVDIGPSVASWIRGWMEARKQICKLLEGKA